MHSGKLGAALDASVLVLNRGYAAIHVVNARRAFVMLYRELAEVIDIEDGRYSNYDFNAWMEVSQIKALEKQPQEDWVQAVDFEIQVPRVIRLFSFDRVPKYRLRFNRRNVFARDGYRCQYCGGRFDPDELTFDHIVPRSRNGQTNWENIVCCCIYCNSKKGGRTPEEANMRLIREPKQPSQSPLLAYKLANPKYETWRPFLQGASWAVEVA